MCSFEGCLDFFKHIKVDYGKLRLVVAYNYGRGVGFVDLFNYFFIVSSYVLDCCEVCVHNLDILYMRYPLL